MADNTQTTTAHPAHLLDLLKAIIGARNLAERHMRAFEIAAARDIDNFSALADALDTETDIDQTDVEWVLENAIPNAE